MPRGLTDKVSDGDMTLERAITVGTWLLRDNPIAWFGLREKVPSEVLGAG